MNRNSLITVITGMFLMISFQNCSQGNFQASDTAANQLQGSKTIISDDQIQNLLDQDRAYSCPAIRCALPPAGYHYEADNSVDSLCPTSCGRLVADSIGGIRQHPIACPDILCSAVPEGCKRVAAANTVKDVNGCNLSCGDVVCEDKSAALEDSTKENIRCPAIRCAAPPENCYYRQETPADRDSAKIQKCPTCGVLICKKAPVGTDLPPVPAE